MALKKKYAKKEDIPVAALAAYVERGGEWVLDAEEDSPSPSGGDDRLKEFRDNNLKLAREKIDLEARLQELRDKTKDFDPVKYEQAKAVIAQVSKEEERNLISAGKFDEVISRRTAAALTESADKQKALETALAEKAQETETLRTRLGSHLLEKQMQIVAGNKGLRFKKGALEDAIARTNRGWKIDAEGKAVAIGADGKPRYNAKAAEYTMEDFVGTDLLEQAPHLFESATGGGANGNKSDQSSPDGQVRFPKNAQLTRDQIKMVAEGKAILV